jgi:formate--tetrahydrofolate ligase
MEPQPISAVARSLGIEPRHLVSYGEHKAKVSLDAIRPTTGKLIAVTGITPTPAGEGKTLTCIGLVQALGKLGHNAAVTLREPSLGPLFGLKGGGTGGGASRVLPEDDINLHFTGDTHAVGAAHNLLSALTDNAVRRGQVSGLQPSGITWRRVTPVEDRALRQITTGLGGSANGPVRETGFDITEASEIMAILALASDHVDLRRRLAAITVGYADDGRAITAKDIGAVGSLMALLNDALLPNLVQTSEGQPALVHTGPFGNIAHGCSSVVADRLALGYADYVVTECGFGADLGFEKFMHIKARSAGLCPSAVVLVATIRALKSHGGAPADALHHPDPIAVRIGSANLDHMVGLVRSFGLPVVVAINRFPADTPEEVIILQDVAIAAGASAAVISTCYQDGGQGATDLAQAVTRLTEGPPPEVTYMYPPQAPLRDKVRALVTKAYGARGVHWSVEADRRLAVFEKLGLDALPVCMAKTSSSISHDPSLKGRPSDYTFEISDVRASTGAGFVYPIAGPVTTMPGLPREPRSLDVDADGNVTGL